ncbi:hypothetical protein CN381_28585 [Bacillus cereus]|nr:hypothetical protein CN381_28585 [Bacillus cereus]
MFYGSIHFFIHSYSRAVLGLLFVTGLAEKLYKILHDLSVGGQNAGGTPVMNDMAIKLPTVLFIPLCLALLVKVILM